MCDLPALLSHHSEVIKQQSGEHQWSRWLEMNEKRQTHSCQNHDSTMRFYDFTTQIERNNSMIILSTILDFTIWE